MLVMLLSIWQNLQRLSPFTRSLLISIYCSIIELYASMLFWPNGLFSQAFNGKRWEKFNSEKVASLAYARIQGKSALVAHFQNSSLMNEDKRCRPILFHSGGPNIGDQVFFSIYAALFGTNTKMSNSVVLFPRIPSSHEKLPPYNIYNYEWVSW